MEYYGLRMHRAVGCWHVVCGESDPRGSSPTACLGSGANVRAWESRIWRASAVQCPVINYAILSPCDIFIAHLYLIRGQDGGADVDIVLMAIYSES